MQKSTKSIAIRKVGEKKAVVQKGKCKSYNIIQKVVAVTVVKFVSTLFMTGQPIPVRKTLKSCCRWRWDISTLKVVN